MAGLTGRTGSCVGPCASVCYDYDCFSKIVVCYVGFVIPDAATMASILEQETSLLTLVALHFHDGRWCIESSRLPAS